MIVLEYLLILLIVLTAVLALFTKDELISIIILSIFSTVLSVLYLLYKAPDVALAEVVIGAGLSTGIFMAAISQIRSGKKSFRSREEE